MLNYPRIEQNEVGWRKLAVRLATLTREIDDTISQLKAGDSSGAAGRSSNFLQEVSRQMKAAINGLYSYSGKE